MTFKHKFLVAIVPPFLARPASTRRELAHPSVGPGFRTPLLWPEVQVGVVVVILQLQAHPEIPQLMAPTNPLLKNGFQ